MTSVSLNIIVYTQIKFMSSFAGRNYVKHKFMRKNPVFIILGILVGLNLLAWMAVGELAGSGGLEVTFFDVGQGDAALMQGTVAKTSDGGWGEEWDKNKKGSHLTPPF